MMKAGAGVKCRPDRRERIPDRPLIYATRCRENLAATPERENYAGSLNNLADMFVVGPQQLVVLREVLLCGAKNRCCNAP